MVAFGGILTVHSVKNTMNWSVLIIPQRNFRDAPRTMLSAMLPEAKVFAELVAVPIAAPMAAASSALICEGSSTKRALPEFISTFESGSVNIELSKLIIRLSGDALLFDTADGFEYVI